MKILVTGAAGLTGAKAVKYFRQQGAEVLGLCFPSMPEPDSSMQVLDVRDKQAVTAVFEEFKPEAVIHAGGLTDLEYCEENTEEAWSVNAIGTGYVGSAAHQCSAKIVFFSTDHVFDGKEGPYDEDSPAKPLSQYGKSNLAAERIVAGITRSHLIVRTSGIYGWTPGSLNFVMQLVKTNQAGEPQNIPDDQYCNPTLADNLVEATAELLQKNLTGTYHVAGADYLSMYGFAMQIAGIFGLDEEKLTPVSTESMGHKARRPLKAGLKTGKAGNCLSVKMLGVSEGLEHVKRQQTASQGSA